MSIVHIHPIGLAVFELLDEKPDDNTDAHSEILAMYSLLRAMSHRWPIALAAFRMYQVSASQRGRSLSAEIRKLFEEFEKEEWKHNELQLHKVNSRYSYMDGGHEQTDIRNVSEFFETITRLEISDEVRGSMRRKLDVVSEFLR